MTDQYRKPVEQMGLCPKDIHKLDTRLPSPVSETDAVVEDYSQNLESLHKEECVTDPSSVQYDWLKLRHS